MAASRNEVAIDLMARNNATRELDAASKSLQGLGTNVEAMGQKTGKWATMVQGFFLQMGMSAQRYVQDILMKGVALAGDSIIGFNSRVEQAMIGFTTMLGSAAKAQGFMEELQDFAAKTPFEFDGLRQSANLIMAMGFEAKEVIPLLTAAGDAVAALGLGTEAVQRVVYALGQMRAAGRVTGQDMMQLSAMGIPAWKMLADSMNLTVQEAKKLAEQGKIDAETAIAAITTAIEEGNMGGMMAAQARTFNGAVSTIKDTIQIVVSQAFKPLFDVVSKNTIAIADFLGSEGFLDWADEARVALSGVIDQVLGIGESLAPLVEALLPALASLFDEALEIGGRAFTAITLGLGGVFSLLSAAMPMIIAVAPTLLQLAIAWKAAAIAVGLYRAAIGLAAAAQLAMSSTALLPLKNLLAAIPLLFTGGATGARLFAGALNAAMGPIGWVAAGIGVIGAALALLKVDVGGVVDSLAMDFGDMGTSVNRLADVTGMARDDVKDALSDMRDAYELNFEEATYVLNEFGDDWEDMADNVAGLMEGMDISVGQASELAKAWGDDWESSMAKVNEATLTTGISWDTMQQQMQESYGFLSATDQMNMMLAAAERGPEAWKALMDGYQGVDEETKNLAEQFDLLRTKIDESGTAMVASVVQTTDGIVVTLTDGTELVGTSADNLLGQIGDAAQRARDMATNAVKEMLDEITSLFDSEEEATQAAEDFWASIENPFQDADQIAFIIGQLTNEKIPGAFTTGSTEANRRSADYVEGMLARFDALYPGMLSRGQDAGTGLFEGMEPAYDEIVAWATDTFAPQLMQGMSLEEAMRTQGFDNLADYMAGMRAQDRALQTQGARSAEAARRGALSVAYKGAGITNAGEYEAGLRSEANDLRLAGIFASTAAKGGFDSVNFTGAGSAAIMEMVNGINDNIWRLQSAMRGAAQAARAVMPESEPKDPRSPLRGLKRLGGNIIGMVSDGVFDALPEASRAAEAMAGAFRPDVSASFGGFGSTAGFGGGFGGEFGGGGGGVTIINHFGAGSVRSEDDIHAISRQLALQVRMETL